MNENEGSDIQIEPIESEISDYASTPTEFEIATYPADYTLEVLYRKMQSGEIVIPKFQRGFVWKIEQSSRLIESFLLGLPVPQIFVYADQEQKLLIIDGQQRLRSIGFFFDGFFGEADKAGKRKVFKLEGINEDSRWSGKSYEDFEDSDKRKLNNSVLRAIMIKQINPDDDTSIYHIFERLNTGGTLLKNQEVRNCVYQGKLNDLLLELNKLTKWRNLLGRQNLDTHQRDIELILRFMALFRWGEKYKKPMKDFLSSFMRRNRNPDDRYIDTERTRFKQICEIIYDRLGEKSFHPRGSLNASACDAILVAFARNISKIPDDIQSRHKSLLKNSNFLDCISISTTDVEVVKKRLLIAEKILFE